MSVVLWILLAALLLLCAGGAFTFYAACVRRKEPDWLDREQVEKTPYAQHFDAMTAADRWIEENKQADVSIQSADGLKLHGRWIPAENARGTVLLVHGYRSSVLVDFGLALEFYHDLGMNILLPDQRSHGKSEGKYITFGVRECEDMRAWIAFHNREYGLCPLFVFGLSMGASTTLYMADMHLPDNVRGLIADCGFSSPAAIIGDVFRKVTHLSPKPILWVTELCARAFASFSLYEKNTEEILKKSRYPILFIHGTEDHYVPCDMTERGYASCTSEKELLLVEGAEHGASFLKDRPRYVRVLTEFLDRILDLHE